MQVSESSIKQMFGMIGFPEAEISIDIQPEVISIQVDVPTQDSGILIGYHGEKIEAMKLILNLIHNNGQEVYTPIHWNVNDYRQRRNKNLEELADDAVQKAIDSKQEILLPPLSAYERRVVHLYVEENKQEATTYSEGEGSSRRLVVRPNVD